MPSGIADEKMNRLREQREILRRKMVNDGMQP